MLQHNSTRGSVMLKHNLRSAAPVFNGLLARRQIVNLTRRIGKRQVLGRVASAGRAISFSTLEGSDQGWHSNTFVAGFVRILAWFKKGSGTVVRSTRPTFGRCPAVPATVPDPFLNHARIQPGEQKSSYGIYATTRSRTCDVY